MTQEQMNILVPEKLREIEREQHIEVLLAVESGSRAWGFASPDSDFDVRFIYRRRQEDYLRLEGIRDVIELPIDDTWDVNGWDIDKTLKLLYKSNPTLFEWINSPICYCRTDFCDRIMPLMEEYFSEKKMLHHYMNMAHNNERTYFRGTTVNHKKYFYVLRPVLACLWVMERKSAPPVLFSELVDAVLPEELAGSVERLLDLKMNGPEKMEIERIPDIDLFLEQTIVRIDAYMSQHEEGKEVSWEPINRFFLSEISRQN